MQRQIKSRKRVSDYGEVYTNEREVNAMLDLVKEEAARITSRFLEPACGNGNFLVEILRRKLASVSKFYGQDKDAYMLHMIEAVASIYAVDIQEDNVIESRERLLNICREQFQLLYGQSIPDKIIGAVDFIMKRNILCGNTLSGFTGYDEPIVFSEWTLNEDNMFEQREFLFTDILENRESSISIGPVIHDWM